MIRSSLKSGLKRLLGVEVRPAAAPPPPAWRDAPPVRVEPPAAKAPVVEVAPAAVAAAALPVETPAPSTVETPAPSTVETPAPPTVEAAPVVDLVEAAPAKRPKAKKKAKPAAEVVAAAEPAAAVEAAPVPEAATPATDTVGPAAYSMEQVQEIFDEMVRPALQGDGGDITLLRIDGNDVIVKLVGSCSTCPSSIMTMKMGVEALLREELPGFGNLIQEG
ncbi:MAG: NifU family protein [Myxococcales bacterium]|nr:NifU family protein [Myxococcales bacterium]